LNSYLQISDQIASAGTEFAEGKPIADGKPTPPPRFDREMPSHRFLTIYLLQLLSALACVGLATLGLLLLDRVLPISLFPVVYLIPVVVAATRWGTGPAIAAALAGGAAADFLFF
jgi:K+-sensing histidine kinase KdpD